MSCHPARIPPGWRRGVPGRCFVQSPAPARFCCRCGMGPRGKSAQKYGAAGPVGWACRCCAPSKPPGCPLRPAAGHGAAGARVLDGIIQQDHRQPMQGGSIPLHGLAGVRPLQSGYSPANLLRLSSIYRYSIPQLAENRLKKCGRFLRLPHFCRKICEIPQRFYSSSRISAATSARSRRVSMAVFSIMRWASASLMPLCSIR